jgi:hypothetical protein
MKTDSQDRTSSTASEKDIDAFPHARRNFALGITSGAIGGTGGAFTHPELILAGLICTLADSPRQAAVLVAILAFVSRIGMTTPQILAECESLERFRQTTENLYDGVRASLLLFAAHRFYLQDAADVSATGHIPHAGYVDLLERRFEEAIGRFRAVLVRDGPNGAICSALASAYHHATFQMLTDQVRRSVRSARGNQWMFRVGHRADHPVRVRPELLRRPAGVRVMRAIAALTR